MIQLRWVNREVPFEDGVLPVSMVKTIQVLQYRCLGVPYVMAGGDVSFYFPKEVEWFDVPQPCEATP